MIFLVLISCGRRPVWFTPQPELDNVTYCCPCEKQSCRESILTCINVCPCALLIVTVNDALTIFLNLKEKSLGIVAMRGIITV